MGVGQERRTGVENGAIGAIGNKQGSASEGPKYPGQEFDIDLVLQRNKDEILSTGVVFSMCVSEIDAPRHSAILGVPTRCQKVFASFCISFKWSHLSLCIFIRDLVKL